VWKIVVARPVAFRCQGREEVAALVKAAGSSDWRAKAQATEIQLATGMNREVD
jgi:hypothetical protein